MYRHLLVVGFACLLLGADKCEDAVKKEKEKLQGTWRVTSMVFTGGEEIDEDKADMRMVFAGDKIQMKGGGKEVESTYKIDPASELKTIDLTFAGGIEKVTTQGIYELNGDKLRIAYSAKPGARPKKFDPDQETLVSVFTLKREKK